jgi:hypothetical protein
MGYGPMIGVDVNLYRDDVKWPTKTNINADEAMYISERSGSL